MKKLLVLVDPGFESGKEPYLKEIAESEGELVLLTNADQRVSLKPWWLKYVDRRNVLSVSFRNPEIATHELAVWAAEHKILLAGFYTYFEESVPFTNALANYFKTTPICTGNVLAVRHKGLMRSTLREAGLAQPKFIVTRDRQAARAAVEKIGVPCVIKPAQFLASLGVLKIESPDPQVALDAFESAQRIDIAEEDTRHAYDLSPEVIVEEYLPADFEMTCEGIVQRGQLVDFFLTGKLLGKEPHFTELVHWHPMEISSVLIERLKDSLELTLSALKLHSCVVHAEFRVKDDKPTLIEIAARVAGGLIPIVIEEATSSSLLLTGVALAKGEEVSCRRTENGFACIFFVESEKQLELAKTLGPGEVVKYPAGDGYYGHYRPHLSGQRDIQSIANQLYSA